MGKTLMELDIRQFTFAILGSWQHWATDVDSLIDPLSIKKNDVINYLHSISHRWDNDFLEAVRADMEDAFEEFFGFYTTIESPKWGIDSLSGQTCPDSIIMENPHGRLIYLAYKDGVIIDEDGDVFDTIPWIEEQRRLLGLAPLASLEFDVLSKALSSGTREYFRQLQKDCFRYHTLYGYACEIIENKLGEKRQTAVQDNENESGNEGSYNTEASSTKSEHEESEMIPDAVARLIRGKKGIAVAAIILAAEELGMLPDRPSSARLVRMGACGSVEAIRKYLRNPKAIPPERIAAARAALKKDSG
ncbi:MAG: hypothetical protein K2M85_04800 [Paramuribaculum sp.]|nr:hypothetical protein [Paramuribaculum sp.]